MATCGNNDEGTGEVPVSGKMSHVGDNDGTVGGNQCPTLLNPSGESGISTSPDPNDWYVRSLLPNYDGGVEGGQLGSAQDRVETDIWSVYSNDGEWTYSPDYDDVGGNRRLPIADCQGGIMSNYPNDQYVQSSVAGEELDQASLGHGEVGGQSNGVLQTGQVQYDPSQRDERKKSSSWTELEHKILLVGITVYGRGNWKTISKKVLPSKTPSQIASHAQKYFERDKLTKNMKKRRSIHDIGLEHLTEKDKSHMEKLFKGRGQSRSQPGLSRPHPLSGQPQERLVGHPHRHLQTPAMHTMPALHGPVIAPSYVETNLPPPYLWNTEPSSTLDTHPQNPEYRSSGGMRSAVYIPTEVQLPAAGLLAVEPLYPANYFVQLLNGEYPLTPPHMSHGFRLS